MCIKYLKYKKGGEVMFCVGPRSSYGKLFRKLNILPIVCQYIFSLMLFIVDNEKDFLTNEYLNGLDTRNKIIYICLL